MLHRRQILRHLVIGLGAVSLTLGAVGAVGAPSRTAAVTKEPDVQRTVTALQSGGDPGCDGSDLLTLTAGMNSILEGDTSGGVSNVEGYGCKPWSETGPEAVYRLRIDEPVTLHALLDSPAELDLFLLNECEADSCLAASIREFVIELAPRVEPYVLVVDGYLGAEGPFTLELETFASGVPANVCADALQVAVADTARFFSGNLFDLENQLLSAPCGSFMERGGEQWYALVVPPRRDLDVTLLDLYFDGALWLFDGCGPDAECFGFADAALAEGTERLAAVNESNESVVWYLAVDAFQAVSSENGFIESDGAYTLEITGTSNVPAENRDWGGVKALFR